MNDTAWQEFSDYGLQKVIRDLWRSEAEGTLKAHFAGRERTLYFENGLVQFGHSEEPNEKLHQVLIAQGVLSEEQFEAVRVNFNTEQSIGRNLLEMGLINRAEFIKGVRGTVFAVFSACMSATNGTYYFDTGVLPKKTPKSPLNYPDDIVRALLQLKNKAWVSHQFGDDLDFVVEMNPDCPLSLDTGQIAPYAAEMMTSIEENGHFRRLAFETDVDDFILLKFIYALKFLGFVTIREDTSEGGDDSTKPDLGDVWNKLRHIVAESEQPKSQSDYVSGPVDPSDTPMPAEDDAEEVDQEPEELEAQGSRTTDLLSHLVNDPNVQVDGPSFKVRGTGASRHEMNAAAQADVELEVTSDDWDTDDHSVSQMEDVTHSATNASSLADFAPDAEASHDFWDEDASQRILGSGVDSALAGGESAKAEPKAAATDRAEAADFQHADDDGPAVELSEGDGDSDVPIVSAETNVPDTPTSAMDLDHIDLESPAEFGIDQEASDGWSTTGDEPMDVEAPDPAFGEEHAEVPDVAIIDDEASDDWSAGVPMDASLDDDGDIAFDDSSFDDADLAAAASAEDESLQMPGDFQVDQSDFEADQHTFGTSNPGFDEPTAPVTASLGQSDVLEDVNEASFSFEDSYVEEDGENSEADDPQDVGDPTDLSAAFSQALDDEPEPAFGAMDEYGDGGRANDDNGLTGSGSGDSLQPDVGEMDDDDQLPEFDLANEQDFADGDLPEMPADEDEFAGLAMDDEPNFDLETEVEAAGAEQASFTGFDDLDKTVQATAPGQDAAWSPPSDPFEMDSQKVMDRDSDAQPELKIEDDLQPEPLPADDVAEDWNSLQTTPDSAWPEGMDTSPQPDPRRKVSRWLAMLLILITLASVAFLSWRFYFQDMLLQTSPPTGDAGLAQPMETDAAQPAEDPAELSLPIDDGTGEPATADTMDPPNVPADDVRDNAVAAVDQGTAARDSQPPMNQPTASEPTTADEVVTEQESRTVAVGDGPLANRQAARALDNGKFATAAQLWQEQVRALDGRFTLGLFMVCNTENVADAFEAAAGDVRFFIVPKRYAGKPCYWVCWGEFASKGEALAARGDMPPALQDVAAEVNAYRIAVLVP